MSRSQSENNRSDERSTESEFGATPCGAEVPCPCGGSMTEMMQASPCAGVLKRHRLAVYTGLTVAGLGFLILHAGWLLGVVAFFRTI